VSFSEEEGRVEVAFEKGQPGEPLLFNHVLNQTPGPGEQEALFNLIRPHILGALEGQSSTIVTFGGPQSGKTYALSGFFTHTRLHGLAPRAIQLIMDNVEKDAANSPIIEASFFEIGHDAVYDLVPGNMPRVAMVESSKPPYVKMEDKLSAQRCDGQAGYNRLLDTYFTGLEHRRKGTHTCFQITFVFEDRTNPQRPTSCSHLRFIEMAWPRSHVSAATGQQGVGAKPKAAAAVPQDRAVERLDQVLQCKLTGSGAPPYRSSPLVLLLKPCFEGSSLLNFIYCLRLEHSHLTSLTSSAGLLAKLHLWMSRSSGARELLARQQESVPAVISRAGLGNLPLVPPLQLQAGGQPVQNVPIAKATKGAHDESTDRSSVGSSESGSPLNAGSGSVAIPRLADADAGAGANETPQGQQRVLEPVIDMATMRECAMALEVKKRCAEMLRADAERSAMLRESLNNAIQNLGNRREACGEGICEKETNLKMLCEKVTRSLQRSTEEMQMMYEDIETIVRFCEGGVVPPIYDSYNVTEADVQKLAAHMHDAGQLPLAAAVPYGPGDHLQPMHEVREDNIIRIPQLPLDLLPQERVEAVQVCPTNAISPSSASSCSELEVSGSLMSKVALARSPALVSRAVGSVNYVQNMVALPQTPPIPQPQGLQQRLLLGWQQPLTSSLHAPIGAAHFGHVNANPGQSIKVQAARDDDFDHPEVHHMLGTAAGSRVLPPGMQHSASAMQLTGQPSDGVDMDSRLRKTRSMRSFPSGVSLSSGQSGAAPPMRTGASVATSPAPPSFGSPLLGHRSTMTSASPLRAAMAGSSGSMAAPAGTSAQYGGTSPLLAPKRSLLQTAAGRGPQRPGGATNLSGSMAAPAGSMAAPAGESNVVRQQTPVPQVTQPTKGQQGARGSAGATAHSPSPVMMRRSVSTQGLRVERSTTGTNPNSKPHEKAVVRNTSSAAAPGGPSPERQRPAGAQPGISSGLSPIRTKSPAHRPSQTAQPGVRV